MRKLIYALSLLVFFSCSKDTLNEGVVEAGNEEHAVLVATPQGAVAGQLSVKLSEAVADKLEEALNVSTRAGVLPTRSGISEMDVVFDQIGVEHFSRVFPYEPEYEERHREAGLHLWYNVNFDEEKDLQKAAQLLSVVGGVKVVEFNHEVKSLRQGPVVPYNIEEGAATRAKLPMNDPGLKDQWHYSNNGLGGSASHPHQKGADISLFDAWELTTGSPEIIVAVLDEPVQTSHPDIKDNLWVNPKPGYTTSGQTFKNDIHGFNFWNNSDKLDWRTSFYDPQYAMWVYSDHGSHVAGTVAAVNNNKLGVCGVAGGNGTKDSGVKIMSCQILGNSNDNRQLDAAARAFIYAADRGALIAQCSWGYGEDMTYDRWISMQNGKERDAIDYFIKTAGKDNPNSPLKGGLVVFAAGNSGHMIKDRKTWPAAYKPVLSVASMGPDFMPAFYTDYGNWVNVTAPGGEAAYGEKSQILSLILEDPTMTFKDGRKSGYGFMQGTSMACPHVSGIAALGLSYAAKLGKQFTVDEYMSLLMTSCNEIDGYFKGVKNVQGYTLYMRDYRDKMGAGAIDAYKFLLNIAGTPNVCVTANTDAVVDLSKYLSGRIIKGKVTARIDQDAMTKLGIQSYSVNAGKFKVNCSKVGAAKVTFETKIGEATVTDELVIISRAGVPENGMWL